MDQPLRKVLKRKDLNAVAVSGADIKREYVPTPEWADIGDDPDTVFVCIRALTGSERDAYEASVVSIKGKDRQLNLVNVRAKLVSKVLIDPETGERLYSDAEVAELGKRSAAVLDRIFDAARKLSGLTEDDVKELTEELKNGQSA